MEPLSYQKEPGWRIRIPLVEGSRLRIAALVAMTLVLLVVQSVACTNPILRTDFAALIIVYLALENPPLSGSILALLIGYLADLFSGDSRGLSSASMVLVFLLVRLLVVRFTGAKWFMITAVSIIGTLLALFVRWGIEVIVGRQGSTLHGLTPAIPALLIGAVLFGYPCYRLLRSMDDRFKPREDHVAFGSTIPRRE